MADYTLFIEIIKKSEINLEQKDIHGIPYFEGKIRNCNIIIEPRFNNIIHCKTICTENNHERVLFVAEMELEKENMILEYLQFLKKYITSSPLL